MVKCPKSKFFQGESMFISFFIIFLFIGPILYSNTDDCSNNSYNLLEDCSKSNSSFCNLANCNECLYQNPIRCERPQSSKNTGFILLIIGATGISISILVALVRLYFYNKKENTESEHLLQV